MCEGIHTRKPACQYNFRDSDNDRNPNYPARSLKGPWPWENLHRMVDINVFPLLRDCEIVKGVVNNKAKGVYWTSRTFGRLSELAFGSSCVNLAAVQYGAKIWIRSTQTPQVSQKPHA